MPTRRFRGLAGLILALVWLISSGLVEFDHLASLALAGPLQDPADPDGDDAKSTATAAQPPRVRRPAARTALQKKGRRPAGGAADKSSTGGKSADPKAAANKDDKAAASPASEPVSFKRDVAPILVANCVGCHTQGRPGLSRGKLEMTSFAKLMEGTPKEKVITPGKPDESHLVRRVRGEERPRMPQGNDNNRLTPEAISRIAQWIKDGARLDDGLDPQATLESYALPPDQLRRNLLARLSARERDLLVEKAGRDRWKKASPRLVPEITQGEHFILFSNLPRERATNTVKFLDTLHGNLRRLLGSSATSWAEKVSVYVFNSRKDFVELVRSIENREPDEAVVSVGSLTVAQPYIAVVDPLGGKKEEPAAARRKPRGKRTEEKDADRPARTLDGLLAAGLGEAAVLALDKAPHWLAYGVGGALGARAEPRGPYYAGLRKTAHERFERGWITRASDVLGETDNVSAEDMRAISLAIVESLLTPDLRGSFPLFVKGMSQGKEKLDDALKEVYDISREDFLNSTGEWVAQRYGRAE